MYHATKGSAATSSEYKFNIPLYGDLFSDIVLNAVIPPIQALPKVYDNDSLYFDSGKEEGDD